MSKILFGALIILLSFSSWANENRVMEVYVCGDDIGIEVENIGWLVVLSSQNNEKRIDRIYSMALSLLATQAPIGFTNPREPIRWCGIEGVKPITVMQATRN